MAVDLLPGRNRYHVVGLQACWLEQQGSLDGKAPRTATLDADAYDPQVSPGRYKWGSTTDPLTEGGLFKALGDRQAPLVVEAVDLTGVTTFRSVQEDGATVIRDLSGLTPPFKLAAGEFIQAVGGSKAAILVRVDGEKVF